MNVLMTRGQQKIAAAQRTTQGAYWKKQLAGRWDKACFPFDTYPVTETRLPALAEFPVASDLVERLSQLSKHNPLSLHVILTAGMLCQGRRTFDPDRRKKMTHPRD